MPSYSSGEPVLVQKTGCFGPNPGPNKKSFAGGIKWNWQNFRKLEKPRLSNYL